MRTILVSFAVLNLYVISFVELPFDLLWDTNLNLSVPKVLCDPRLGANKFVPYTTMIFHDGCIISEILLSDFSDLTPDTKSTPGVK